MEETQIRNYAKLMQELELTGLEITEDGTKLRLERHPAAAAGTAIPVMAPTALQTASVAAPSEEPGVVSIPSPMVGVFYTSPAENQPPFVSVGDRVSKGDVLCVIESMKLMNEIVSDYDGTVVEVCVSNQQVVDFGHVLFRIRKETP